MYRTPQNRDPFGAQWIQKKTRNKKATWKSRSLFDLVGGGGLEPPTPAL